MPKKFYLTKEGLKKIEKEYQDLKEIKLAKTKGESPKIWHSEDVNPEYITFQEDLNFLETRLSELEYILKNVELIKMPPRAKQNIVSLGATVLVDLNGQTNEFKIVGTLEADPLRGKISNESLVGRTIIGHRIGDKIIIFSPTKTVYRIKKIKYLSS